MKENQGFSQKFNPNPFTGGKDDSESDAEDDSDKKKGGLDFSRFIPFGNRKKRSLFGGDGKNPVEKNFEINKVSAELRLADCQVLVCKRCLSFFLEIRG